MADQERLRAMNAARVRRWRQRQREQAEVEAERTARRAEAIATRLEKQHPACARILADLAPEVAGAVVAALNRRQFERAEARARSQDQGERLS